jgi:membrane associated rhomboid family serine protease
VIPLRHTEEPSVEPVITRGLVLANVVVFIAQVMMGPKTEAVIRTFGFVPARLFNPEAFGFVLWEVSVTLVSSLFLHGGFVHLAGNMIYLWVFGGAVEAALGRERYAGLYVACGVFGSLAHATVFPSSAIPSIGASGCIAGVLGAFFVLRPHARIVTLFPLVIYWAMAEIPAALFLPVWFGMQFFNGFLALAAARGTQDVAAGIAWWAHVGGFLFGFVATLILRPKHEVRRAS